MKYSKLAILTLIWLILALPCILFLIGCESAQPLPEAPKSEDEWRPAPQSPIYAQVTIL